MYGIAAETFSVYSSDGSLIRWRTSSVVFAPEFTSVVESASVVNHLGQQYVVVLHFSPQALKERLTTLKLAFLPSHLMATLSLRPLIILGQITCSSQKNKLHSGFSVVSTNGIPLLFVFTIPASKCFLSRPKMEIAMLFSTHNFSF